MTRAPESEVESATQIEEAAARWVAITDRPCTPDEWAQLDKWMSRSPRHRAAFLRMSEAWRRSDILKRLARFGERSDPDLLASDRAPVERSITVPPRPRLPQKFSRYAVAAVLLVVVLVGAGLMSYQRDHPGQVYSTALGEFHRVTLPDGSSISLNTDTQVRVWYTVARRKVYLLRGEALFDVEHDVERPFEVVAGNTVLRDVGTAFSVRRRSDEAIDVLVSEGSVAINPPSEATLMAGDFASVRNNVITRRDAQSADDISRRLAWLDGRVRFDGQTLSEAVAELNRYTERKLVISDPAIETITIAGIFVATKPDLFAAALKRTVRVESRTESTERGTEIRLYARAP